MTLQRSLSLSVFVHILICGSAILVAQYARGTFLAYPDHIMVSLVAPGTCSGVRASQGSRHHELKPDSRPSDAHSAGSATIQSRVQPDLSGISSPQPQGSIGASDADVRKQEAGTGAAPQSGARFGLIPPEQWTIISAALEKSKSYPRMARERGIEGVVRLRFRLKPSGDVERVEIAGSSGYDILDTASIRTVYRASPMPYVNGWVEVPMAYVLK